MGQQARLDSELVSRLHYTMSKLSDLAAEYETEALATTRVLSHVSVVKALILDVERRMKEKVNHGHG